MDYETILKSYNSLLRLTDFEPRLGIVLGTGFSGLLNEIKIEQTVDYKDIVGMPVSSIEGHKGEFVFGYLGDTPVMIMNGRIHYYEGYSMAEVVLPIRLMKLMGVKAVLLTNAAGSVNQSFKAGDLMLIKDQISTFVPSPLCGPNIDRLGVRFPDMHKIYDKEMREFVKMVATSEDIALKEGVYVQVSGPAYETPSEVKLLRAIGADAVGMSTAVEAVAARHCGLRVCGLSCITNASGGTDTHEQVQAAVKRAEAMVNRIIRKISEVGLRL